MTIIATDADGVVRLVTDGEDPGVLPSKFNDIALTAHVLTQKQEELLAALPEKRGPAVFDGTSFSALPAPADAAPAPSLDDVVAVLPQASKDALAERMKGKPKADSQNVIS